MDLAEIAWRSRSAARVGVDRVRFTIAPGWNRRQLARLLAPTPALHQVRAALDEGQWQSAHAALARHFVDVEPRFVISAAMNESLAARLHRESPGSASEAAARADRIVAGEYDLLGYHALRFGSGRTPDWAYDPVHDRRPPCCFYTGVRYLDAACGDHKIIWELNRHQHWLTLGRAYWLTGQPKYRQRFVEELESWLAANPPLTGINWASMLELALRSLSWLWALHFFAAGGAADRSPWVLDLLLALDQQLRHVERHLSVYFSPNTHLLGEALALYVVGRTVPELAASGRRESIGRALLVREIDRQIASDGGHCERSTHYHRYTLDFYLLALAVARITSDPVAADFERAATRLARAARLMADDEGRLPHIGDDDGGTLMPLTGRAPDDIRGSLAVASVLTRDGELYPGATPEEAVWILEHPALAPLHQQAAAPSRRPAFPRSAALRDTGYYVSRNGAGDHLVIDGGRHGYQNGGHAHADALSVTFTREGVPLLIDPGTASYTADPLLRDRFRSTALHNTLTLDDRPQSEPLGPFHWARTAHGRVHRWRTNASFDFFDGSHDGYWPIEHRRRVLALHGDLVVVADFVNGSGHHVAAVHWHIDPRWTVGAESRNATIIAGAARVGLSAPHGVMDLVSGDDASGLGWYSPVYGQVAASTTIRVTHEGVAPFWVFSVFDLDSANRVTSVEQLPVHVEAGVLDHVVALEISRTASFDYLLLAEPSPGQPQHRVRVAELETDARMLFARMTRDRSTTRVALVDGSMAGTVGPNGFELVLQNEASDFCIDVAADSPLTIPRDGVGVFMDDQERPVPIHGRPDRPH